MRWHLRHAKYGDKPWAVQAEAARRSDGKKRWGHFLEQGLGKTPLTLNEYVEYGEEADLLIISPPNSFREDWPIALQEWGLDFMSAGIWPRDPVPFEADSGMYVFGHETLRGSRDARDALSELIKRRRCMFVLDESTAIKNPSSQLGHFLIRNIAKDAAMTRLLDGTPMVQNVLDYFAKLRMLGEAEGMIATAFRNRYAELGGYMGKKVIGIRDDHEAELYEMLNRCSFRALKKDWRKDLPPQITVPVHLTMTDVQRKHYQEMMEEFYTVVGIDDDEVIANMVLAQYEKLRQISSCLILNKGKVHWLERPEDNPKVQGLIDVTESGPGKLIAVHYYVETGEMLERYLTKKGYKPARIKGGMKTADIVREKQRFNEDPDCRILVGQQDQTSRGHTLIGSEGARNRCSRIFYFENSFSLYQRLQMNDRNHRGEQDETCMIFDAITSPMDQLVIDILIGKRELRDEVDRVVLAVQSEARKLGIR